MGFFDNIGDAFKDTFGSIGGTIKQFIKTLKDDLNPTNWIILIVLLFAGFLIFENIMGKV